jgi:hypothetical protein
MGIVMVMMAPSISARFGLEGSVLFGDDGA